MMLVGDETFVDPTQAAEDDSLRSSHIRELLRSPVPRAKQHHITKIPMVMIQFWDDHSRLPNDVRECIESWQALASSGIKRLLFDDYKAHEFISSVLGPTYVDAFEKCHHPAMRADYFRLCYLLVQGGFYVDADDFYTGAAWETLFVDDLLKLQPLCYSRSTNSMVPTATFLSRDVSPPDWIYYVNNNPLIAPPFHPVIGLALSRATRILLSEPGPSDIQSTTGPGNMTASLVRYSLTSQCAATDRGFVLLEDWEEIATSRWPLSYRNDHRNWRLWEPPV